MRHAVLALAVLLCSGGIAAAADTATNSAEAPVKTYAGTGEVKEIDLKTGVVVLRHDPIAEIGWPVMTMSFRAVPADLFKSIKVGDKVSFETTSGPGLPEIRAVKKR
jgi:Cu(I)/Ag(I) efflux system periplasmic protein CusF